MYCTAYRGEDLAVALGLVRLAGELAQNRPLDLGRHAHFAALRGGIITTSATWRVCEQLDGRWHPSQNVCEMLVAVQCEPMVRADPSSPREEYRVS